MFVWSYSIAGLCPPHNQETISSQGQEIEQDKLRGTRALADSDSVEKDKFVFAVDKYHALKT